MRRQSGLWLALLLAAGSAPAATPVTGTDALRDAALAAEERLDSRSALESFLAIDQAHPGDAFILQKIAQQYSDLSVDVGDPAEKKRLAQTALGFAQRAVELQPGNPINELSLAICHGKLAVCSDTRAKIQYSRLVKEEADRALALDPNYAWAHHVLGRWHYEIAGLGATTRFFVRVIYGGLPEASTLQAIDHLTRAVQLEPGELAHRLELGFAYAADGQNQKARDQFEAGLAMKSHHKYDESAKARAREELEKLSRR